MYPTITCDWGGFTVSYVILLSHVAYRITPHFIIMIVINNCMSHHHYDKICTSLWLSSTTAWVTIIMINYVHHHWYHPLIAHIIVFSHWIFSIILPSIRYLESTSSDTSDQLSHRPISASYGNYHKSFSLASLTHTHIYINYVNCIFSLKCLSHTFSLKKLSIEVFS